ncbi:flagellar biosynthesis protein FlhA [Stagnimonas aquatica]|uniref:Flagellar biosynthesis protein FlhA n=1 Tax=Stagnimonas aquatica TaxID=2689987 RepID=A0A3N0VDS0_9GAMM|nr:flagellar biosynthesis protein FlhA [Stagnimonas aquatica]ROH90794.1 flagellar biosynthesis protein FlhA [Stagnimonas aquatica]
MPYAKNPLLSRAATGLKAIPRDGLAAPLFLLAILAMMVVPLATPVLDLLFTFNIALSLVILLAVIYVLRPLEFSAFPTVLLLATLLRLALNVASSRVVLMHGHEGAHAAGRVIEAFGHFVIGGNYAVGFIVFMILTIINFMVVTKGAERVSEVSARFVLDAMPGRQMAIDADLNAGLLTREDARARREEIREEADFYGSMDGASKFIRGDAIAGILILFINILGGLLIGVAQHGLPFGEALKNYTLLTIGDGLVAQVPSLLTSVAVAMLVTRMSRSSDMAQQVASQVFRQPRVLAVAAAVLALIGVIPGMPNLVFLILAGACAAGAWLIAKARAQPAAQAAPSAPAPPAELSWDDVRPEDPLGLEVGYRLIPLVDTQQGGELMARIKGVRKKLTQELGFLIQPVHIRDNLELLPNAYRLLLSGVPVGRGQVYPDREMALNPGRVYGELDGIRAHDPAFGMEAVWIEPGARAHAQTLGYTVVDAGTVIATHLSQVVREHAPELLGFDEAQQLLGALAKAAPKLVEDLVPKTLSLGAFTKVLQTLLAEQVPLRNLKAIAEVLADAGARSQDPVTLASAVRVALGRQIVQEIQDSSGAAANTELPVLTLAPALERVLQDSLSQGAAVLEPGLAERMHTSLANAVSKQQNAGEPAVLLVPGPLRPMLARFTRQTVPGLRVLAFNEVPETQKLRLVSAVSP